MRPVDPDALPTPARDLLWEWRADYGERMAAAHEAAKNPQPVRVVVEDEAEPVTEAQAADMEAAHAAAMARFQPKAAG